NFIGYLYDLCSNRFILRWRDARMPESFCQFEFSDVHAVRIEPRDRAYPRDEAGSLSMMIYQELEREAPFMKFWFEDQSTIEIAADKLTLNLYSEKATSDPGIECPLSGCR